MQARQVQPIVKTVLCAARMPGGRALSTVEFSDGCFGVYLDGALSAGKIWGAAELDLCLNAFSALQWELLHAPR